MSATVVKIANNNGPLAQIWLASNMSNLPRHSILQTSISKSAAEVARVVEITESDNSTPLEHITLRTSGELLHGIVRVYSKQAAFLLTDIKDTLTKISSLFKFGGQKLNVTLNKTNTIARVDQLVLEDVVTERDVLAVPGLEFLDDTVAPEGFLARGDSMQRKVQGAAPWDMSLEVGRRFNPDEDLEYHQSSVLDLDFDIEGHHLSAGSRVLEEGTRSTILSRTGSHLGPKLHGLRDVGDSDDLPIGGNDDWDLGITEHGDVGNDSDLDHSVEVGRRADTGAATSFSESIDFGFDLDIQKDGLADQEEENNALEEIAAADFTVGKSAKRTPRVNSAFADVKEIELDSTTELDNTTVKSGASPETIINLQASSHGRQDERLNQKRLWSDFTQIMGNMPEELFGRLLQIQGFKKQKIGPSPDADSVKDPQIDISLGLEDDLVQGSEMDSSFLDNNEDAMVVNDEGNSLHLDANALPLEQQDDLSAASQYQQRRQPEARSEKVQLRTGEVVTKATADAAELLRTQFIDCDVVDFKDMLAKSVQQKRKAVTKREASKSFFEILSLATAECIDVMQESEFDDIKITARSPLYEKFVLA